MSETKISIATARASSTVVLVREGETGPELLLVLRHAKSAFGASYVFPGGVLDAADEWVGNHGSGLDDAAANSVLNLPAGAPAYFSAAVRELFEEAGILLARTAGGDWVDPVPYSSLRDDLNGGRLLWADFIRDKDLGVDRENVVYMTYEGLTGVGFLHRCSRMSSPPGQEGTGAVD